MKIDPVSLEELRKICTESFQKEFSESQLQDIAQRIIRYLKNTETQPQRLGEPIDTE